MRVVVQRVASAKVEVAEQVFNAPVRIGGAGEFNGLIDDAAQPAYSAALGLALYGLRCELGIVGSSRNNTNQNRRQQSPAIMEKVKSFFAIKR